MYAFIDKNIKLNLKLNFTNLMAMKHGKYIAGQTDLLFDCQNQN